MNNSIFNRFIHSTQTYSKDIFIVEAEKEVEFTYNDFFRDSVRISYFFHMNFPDTDTIVLFGKNSYLYAVYVMATILSGKTLFPLNPDEDCAILKNILEKLDGKFTIFADELSEVSTHEMYLIEALKEVIIPEGFVPKGPLPEQDLIYMATSATTGESKIVIQKERALLTNVDDLIEHHKLSERKKIATPLPLFHVNALHFSFFCSLFSGGTLVIFRTFDPRKCFEIIEKKKIDIFSAIPALLTNFLNNYSQLKSYDISSLRYFVSAAAPLSVDTITETKNVYSKKIIQGYGLSEAINFSCTLPIDISDELYTKIMCEEKFPSIGVALKSNEVIVVDNEFVQKKEGEEGELAIKGLNLLSGYLNVSADKVLQNNYFLTGDLGYFKIFEGRKYFFISGRKKEIAKVLGETVPLRELDELLKADKIIKNDFFTVGFENQFKGEEVGIVCELEDDYQVDELVENFKICFEKVKNNRRPKVVLFVVGQSIRTPSGKAKRFFFKEYFKEYLEKRFLNQTFYKVI